MGKAYCLAAAIVILTVSWVSADNQNTKQAVRPVSKPTVKQIHKRAAHPAKKPAPLFIRPGLVVKTQFSSMFPGRHDDMKLQSDTGPDIENDPFFKEELPQGPEPRPQSREEGLRQADDRRRAPARADNNRRNRGSMAPPPAPDTRDDESFGVSAQTGERGHGQEIDLEKDLVLSPPPPRAEQNDEPAVEPSVQTRGAERERRPAREVAERSPRRPPTARKSAPQNLGRQASSAKRIVKVRPVTQNGWSVPAGAYDRNHPRSVAEGYTHDEYRSVRRPPTVQRFVRDGVTVKLAPQAQGAPGGYPYNEGRASDDLLTTATDIIGMPFAFVSSFF